MSEPEFLLGEYEVLRSLGQGGMGHVVLARSRSTGDLFAVKRALLHDGVARARFLAELQTWIDLPAFDHFVACRFFRTLGEEIAIFAEYIEGGSLVDALAEDRLNDLGSILDVAIQLAWGLHAAHGLGVVHQDVKPSNVLLTPTQKVKVADFGLARGGAAQGARFGGALTRGYCSPEQADLAARKALNEGRLTPASDQWSWGVTMLELFTGRPPCPYGGQLAASVLESFLAQGGQEVGRPKMPPLVVEVLRKCFQTRPEERWPSLEAAAEVLAIAYQLNLDTPYPRTKPTWPVHSQQQATDWDDPHAWLRKVYQLAGGEVPEVAGWSPALGGSRVARAVADLAVYEAALRRLTRLCQQGRADLEPLLGELCLAKAWVHRAADDIPGAIRLAEHAIALLRPWVGRGARDCCEQLIEAHLQAGACARLLGQFADALNHTEQAQAACAAQGTPPDRHLGVAYLRTCASRARTFLALEDYPAALAEAERGRSMGQAMVQQDGRTDLEAVFVELDLATARALKDSGEVREAGVWLDRLLPRMERLVEQSGDPALRYQLASATLTRARLLANQDELAEASRVCERALERWHELANREDRPDLLGDIADTLVLQAGLHSRQNLPEQALPLYKQAQGHLEQLVGPLGRLEFKPVLAQVLLRRALVCSSLGQRELAWTLGERGLGVLEDLVAGGRSDLLSDLAWAYGAQGSILLSLDQETTALASLRAAVVLYEDLVHARGRLDLLANWLRALRTETRTLRDRGQGHLSRERLDQAILVGSELVRTRETAEVVEVLADLRIDRASDSIELGEIPPAQAELCEVLLWLEHRPNVESLRQRALTLLTKLW